MTKAELFLPLAFVLSKIIFTPLQVITAKHTTHKIRTTNALNRYLLRWTVILEFQTHGSCSASHQIKHLFQLHASVNIDG